jgi:hypothetical protein
MIQATTIYSRTEIGVLHDKFPLLLLRLTLESPRIRISSPPLENRVQSIHEALRQRLESKTRNHDAGPIPADFDSLGSSPIVAVSLLLVQGQHLF